jgi:NTE family protein
MGGWQLSRALVLTGGGSAGVGWETGLLLGLLERGIDLSDADLIVGTSAGSVVGAQLATGQDFRSIKDSYGQGVAGSLDETKGSVDTEELMHAAADQQVDDASDHDRMVRFGRLALEHDPFPEDLWRANFAQFADQPFPANYACTAIDCESGEFRVWDAAAGAPFDAAVASSCAAPGIFPAVTIDGRRFYDGGVCSATNAQLARGHDKVLVLHMTIVLPDPSGNGSTIQAPDAYPAERELLERTGSEVETVDPSAAVAAVMGINYLDPARIPDVIDASLRQAEEIAARVAAFWA